MTHNEEFDSLRINQELIDPAGVSHGGELADLADTGSSGGSADTGNVMIASPGEVPSVLSNAADPDGDSHGAKPRQVVRLESNTRYEPDQTWTVGRNVVLDFNGARLVAQADRDVIHLLPESELVRPYIDCRPVSFSSNVITLDGGFAGRYGGPNASRIWHATLFASPGEGVGIHMNDSTGNDNVSDCYINGSLIGFDRAIEMLATGSSSAFTNSNHFTVKVMNFRVGVYMRATSGAAVNGNYFDVNVQPYDGTSEWLWDVDNEVSFNNFMSQPWDKHMFTNQTVVRFRSSAGHSNTFIDRFSHLTSSEIVNNSGSGSNTLFTYV